MFGVMFKGTELLEKQCTWTRRFGEHVEVLDNCLRSFAFKDKCGQPWGYAWVFAGIEGGYMVLRYVHGGRTRQKTFKTAYQALKMALSKESKWEYL